MAARRNENRTDPSPISRRMVPWAKPSTKKPAKNRNSSRSTVLMPPRNPTKSTSHLCVRTPSPAAGAEAGQG